MNALRFGPFELDLTTHQLRRNGTMIKLSPQKTSILELLAQSPRTPISRHEFQEKIWLGRQVDEHTLNVAIRGIRTALGDSAKKALYIETLPARGDWSGGYQFVAPVEAGPKNEDGSGMGGGSDTRANQEQSNAEINEVRSLDPHERTLPESSKIVPVGPVSAVLTATSTRSSPSHRMWLHRKLLLWVLAALIALGFLLAKYWRTRKIFGGSQSEVIQLSFNSAENPVRAAAISPDGKYLAYSDKSGLTLRVVDTDESVRIPISTEPAIPADSEIVHIAWFPGSTRLLVTVRQNKQDPTSLVNVSILRGAAVRIAEAAGEAAVSPDGSKIAFVDKSGQQIWTVDPSGENPERVLAGSNEDSFHDLSWFGPDQRLLFGRLHRNAYSSEITIESVGLSTHQAKTILSDPGLRSVTTTVGGGVVYSKAESVSTHGTNLWRINVNTKTGEPVSKPQRITNLPDRSIYMLSVSTVRNRLVFCKGRYQASVYVGDLRAHGAALENPRRLSLDEADDFPTAWTSDSSALFFHSNRNDGKWRIFRQRLSETDAELVVSDQDDDKSARLTPDGASILYFARPKHEFWTWAASTRLMYVPLTGRPARSLFTKGGLYSVRCSRMPADLCVLGEHGLRDLTFYSFDTARGKGHQIALTTVQSAFEADNWDLSPDGTRVALALGGDRDGRIKILSFNGTPEREIIVAGKSGFQSMDWAADGNGLYVSSQTAWGAELLYIDLDGHATVVQSQMGSFLTWGLPSPDGKRLAFLEWTGTGNLWMLDGF